MKRPARLAVLLSGAGRTLANLLDVIDRGDLDATVPLVVTSRECRGADIARARAITTLVIPGEIPADRLVALAHEHAIDLVVLAGYLKLLPIPPALERRVVNIHPALLPAFGGPGMHGMKVHAAVADAARRGQLTQTGCTVHLCDATYDTGPIVLQRTCPVFPDDTPDAIAARVLELEMQTYPEALRLLISGND